MQTRAAGRESSTASDIPINLDGFKLYLGAANRSPRTIVSYAEAINALDAFLAATGRPRLVANLGRDDIESFILSLRDKGQRPATLANRFRSLQQFFKYLREDGEIKESPMLHMHLPHVPPDLIDFPRTEMLDKLLQSCSGTEFEDRRDTAIIRLLMDCGIRRAELSGLKVDDVETSPGVKQLRVLGKGSKWRQVAFKDKAALALNRYLKARARYIREKGMNEDFPWLWIGRRGRLNDSGIGQMLQRRGEEAGIGHIHAHLFRHYWTDRMLRNGMEEGDVMALAGWTTRQMLQRYGAHAQTERALQAYRNLPNDL
jgi:site-specific recombinase XerD